MTGECWSIWSNWTLKRWEAREVQQHLPAWLLDLAVELDKMKAVYEVAVGDWKVRHPRGKPSTTAAGRRNTAVVQRFALGRGLVEPLKERLGWGEVEPRTYRSGGNESWTD